MDTDLALDMSDLYARHKTSERIIALVREQHGLPDAPLRELFRSVYATHYGLESEATAMAEYEQYRLNGSLTFHFARCLLPNCLRKTC